MRTSRTAGARARSLGAELRDLRKSRKLSMKIVGSKLGLSEATISRIETGVKVPTLAEVGGVLAVLGVTGKVRQKILDLASDAGRANWVEIGGPLPSQLKALISFEAEAVRITDVTSVFVPGLLQTIDYARAVIASSGVAPSDEVEARALIRLGRQRILTRSEPTPAELIAVIDEFVLMRPIGGPAVMAAQLRHLAEMAARPNITLHVIPAEAGAHIGLDGAHMHLEFAKATPVVHVEIHNGGGFIDDADEVAAFADVWPTLRTAAMSPTDSVGLIRAHADRMENDDHTTARVAKEPPVRRHD